MIEDVVVALEGAVREPVVADELPDVFDGVEFGRAGRERHQGDIAGDFEGGGRMPSRLIEHDESMGAGFDGGIGHWSHRHLSLPVEAPYGAPTRFKLECIIGAHCQVGRNLEP